MQIVSFIESGHKRRGEEIACKACGKIFTRRLKPIQGRMPQECCSSKCSGKLKQIRIPNTCQQCGNTINRKPSDFKRSKHGAYFCDRLCKEKSQSLDGKCSRIRPSHYKDGSSEYRNRMKSELAKGCVDCKEMRLYILVIHHKDGNRKNGSKDNLEVVCNNCHIKRHLFFNGETWIYNNKFLTPRNMLSVL